MRPESRSLLYFPALVGLVLGAHFPGAPALAAARPPAKPIPAPRPAPAGAPAVLESAVPTSGYGLRPAYLARTGEVDATLEGVVANYATAGQTFAGLQLASFTKLPRNLEAVANLGATLELGVRGPLWRQAGVVLGWDARYRAEPYPSIAQGPGLTPALLGTFPGTQSHGLRMALEGMYPWRGFTFHADPLINVMANRSGAGLALGADWATRSFEVGVGGRIEYNPVNPGGPGILLATVHGAIGAGARYALDPTTAALARYAYDVDAYGYPTHRVVVGVAFRQGPFFK